MNTDVCVKLYFKILFRFHLLLVNIFVSTSFPFPISNQLINFAAFLVAFAFSCGMNQLLWYYAELGRVQIIFTIFRIFQTV